jgi:hypothetical protein
MRQKIWGAKLGIVLAALLFTAGCAAMVLMGLGGAAAIGSYKWIEGTMEKDYPRPMQDCWNASLAAAKDMNLNVQTQQYNPTESTMEGVAPPDTNFKIQLLARPNQITTIKVRFGLMGNQDASAYFHRQVLRHLGLPPT